jgi:integrase
MLQRRADKAWAEADLERITPHACRHSFASLMIAAGVNAKALSTFMGTPTSRSLWTATAT